MRTGIGGYIGCFNEPFCRGEPHTLWASAYPYMIDVDKASMSSSTCINKGRNDWGVRYVGARYERCVGGDLMAQDYRATMDNCEMCAGGPDHVCGGFCSTALYETGEKQC